eukprot:1155620-Pelagomonas_calceolata.AAC.9
MDAQSGVSDQRRKKFVAMYGCPTIWPPILILLVIYGCVARKKKNTSIALQSLEYAIGCLIHFIFLAFYLLIWEVDIVKVRPRTLR